MQLQVTYHTTYTMRLNHTVGYGHAEIDGSSHAMWCHLHRLQVSCLSVPVVCGGNNLRNYLTNWRHYFINKSWKEIEQEIISDSDAKPYSMGEKFIGTWTFVLLRKPFKRETH